MERFVLLTVLVFASKNESDVESAAISREKIKENAAANSIVMKIEEDEYFKNKSKSSMYIGVSYNKNHKRWLATRWSKTKKKLLSNGYHRDEETAAHASDTLARKLIANGEENHKLNFPDDKTEVYREVYQMYVEKLYLWHPQRYSKTEKKLVSNGTYKDEETAAHASDTLARKLMANGEQNHKLNFPDDNTEVHPEEKTTKSKHIGVYYNEKNKTWVATRWSNAEKKNFNNGSYKDEEAAAHASDTLARKLMANGEHNHKLNFPDDSSEVYKKEKIASSKFIGISFIGKMKRWAAQRWSKMEKKLSKYGSYRDEETAAHASDTLARKLMANGEQGHELNFPEEKSEEYPEIIQTNERKRSFDFEYSQEYGKNFEK